MTAPVDFSSAEGLAWLVKEQDSHAAKWATDRIAALTRALIMVNASYVHARRLANAEPEPDVQALVLDLIVDRDDMPLPVGKYPEA